MKSKRKKGLAFLFFWPAFAVMIWMIDSHVMPMSTGLICMFFCLSGCFQSFCFLNVKNQPQDIDAISDKKVCYEFLIKDTEDSILFLNTAGEILLINTKGASYVGTTPEALIGKNAFDILPEKVRNFRFKKFQYVLAQKTSVRYVDERNGIHFDHILSPVYDCTDKMFGVAIYSRDITDLIKNENQLESARQVAEGSNASKSIFLSHVSHELQTPLNVILGYTQILQSVSTLAKSEQKILAKIYKSVELMISLIDDILDLSQIEAQKMSLNIDIINFNELLGYISDIAMMYKHEKGVDFKYVLDSNLPTFVRGDERRLKQVLLNLLVNAFKYTKKGQVFLQITQKDEIVQFSIEDTGIGIDETSIAQIFEPFYRVAKQTEGFGLGLSLARHLVEMMGGQIHVKSTVGKGSTFCFTIFLEPVSEKVANHSLLKEPIIAKQEIRKKVLIIDDQKENRTILKALMAPLGFEIFEANMGESALKLIKEGLTPDLILVDLIMPVMDGFEFANQFHCNFPELPTKIVAVSANTQLQSDQSSMFDARLNKPVQKSQLFHTLSEQLNLNVKSQHSSHSNSAFSNSEIVDIPDQHIRERLINHARDGHITDIKDDIREMENDVRLQSFINKLEFFVTDLDFEGLIDYLKKLDNHSK